MIIHESERLMRVAAQPEYMPTHPKGLNTTTHVRFTNVVDMISSPCSKIFMITVTVR